MAAVRETSPLGPCNVLGPLVRETKTRFVYCPHPGQIAFARGARRAFTLNRVRAARIIRRRGTAPSAASRTYDRSLANEGDVVLGRCIT